MIMNRFLLITWCIELTSENLLKPSDLSAELRLSSPQLNDFSSKWPTVKPDSIKSTAKPEMATTLKTEHAAQNAYKNEYGYSISESYDSHTQKNDVGQSGTVPDTQLLYHSLSNPLFKSNSLNIEPHGDIHKISSPFQSSWIFSPSHDGDGKSVEKRSKSPSLSSIFKGKSSSDVLPTNFTSKFSDNITLNGSDFPSLLDKNSSSFLSNMPSFDKLETFDDLTPGFIASTTTSTTTQPTAQKSFFGYNIKEVTSNGKTHGTVQVYGNDGVAKNVEYNESTKPSNITKLLSNMTTPVKPPKQMPTSSSTPAKKVPAIATTTPKTGNPTTAKTLAESSTTGSPEHPRRILIEDVQPLSRAFTYDQPIATDFATPELILYDFLGQLQSFPYIPTDNFDDNRYTSFDELVSENTYTYRKK